mmetsp:Transcript_19163/g.20774  ORF Transcript_19163/g.20774 Transcript_19163/m.20774 type:complete len:714 (-) Transcript_19163:78-2219(-)
MEKIAFIVDRLNQPPFNKGIPTMTELDSKLGSELLDLLAEVLVQIDPEQEPIFKEPLEFRARRVMQFLQVMKFNIPEDHLEDFQNLLLNYDKEVLYTIMNWCLQRFEHLQKRAYLAKYLMPLDIPAEFLNEDLIAELSQRLKELQVEFKEVHKSVEQVRASGVKPSDLKQEIAQLEQEKVQLQNKIGRMRKDMNVDEDRFKEMLKATSSLRKEQENEVLIHERLREHRKAAQDADARFSEVSKRLSELKSSGIQSQSAEQILMKLQSDVREMNERREHIERAIVDREAHLEKLQSWDSADRIMTEDDVRFKRDEVKDLEEHVSNLSEQLDAAMEKNTKLVVFRQASAMAMKKYREKEDEIESISEELRRLNKQIDEKENELRQNARANGGGNSNGNNNKITKKELKRYGAVVKEKIEVYKKMREELSTLRSELVVLQRTEQVLKSRDNNLEQFLSDLEKQKGVEGYRETQRAIIEMSEKAAEIDQMKGATLEEISSKVELISREFRNKQSQLQPLIAELKNVRQEYLDIESQYQEKKMNYEKLAVSLDLEKQALEKECNQFQEECLREESKYHYLQNLIFISRIKLDRAEQEKKWQSGQGRLVRDFACLKDLYNNKLTQQEQLTKQLRKRQKELKENSNALTNQKSNFANLQLLLDAKVKLAQGESLQLPGRSAPADPILDVSGEIYPTAYAEPLNYGDYDQGKSYKQSDGYY